MKLNKVIFLFAIPVISALTSINANSQGEEKLKSLFIEAESYFLFEEYKDALPLYQRILSADPSNFNINYKIGICYLNDIYQINKSVSYLEEACKGISKLSKTTNFKEKNAPPEAQYYLGNAYRAVNRLNDAIEAYEKFKLILDPEVYDNILVDEQITTCKVAAAQQRDPMYFVSVNLGEKINDKFEEVNPVISGDEKVLVFTRKLQFYDAIFFCKKENGKWSEPENLTSALGLDGNSYSTGLSYKGDELFVYRSDNFDGNLYVSIYKGNKWSKLEKLNGNINTKYWESHATLSKDGKTLYFTSNREGGYGGLDIYKSERNKGGDWGPAINLGPVINSKYNEDTPFLTEDGNTLYFSSMGHYNMGGYDIFYSSKVDNGQWTKPINIGYPLNTTNDDLFFVPVKDGSFAYYSKFISNDSYGMADIFKLEVFNELHPRKFVFNGVTKVNGETNPQYSKYTATLIDPKTGQVIDNARLNADGTFTLNARSGNLELQIKGEGINDKTENILIPVNNPSNIFTHNTMLTAAESITESEVVNVTEENVPKSGPEILIITDNYNVTNNKTIPIRLDLEKNTQLKITTLLNGEYKKKELFDIKRRRFVYMLTPSPGLNTLQLTLTNKDGDSTVREINVIFTPSEEESISLLPVKQLVLSEEDRYKGLISMSDGGLKEYLENLDLSQFKSISDLYNHLVKNAEEHGYTIADIEKLLEKFLSQKDLNLFYDELVNNSSDSLSSYLNSIKLKENGIFTSETLLDYLYNNSSTDRYDIDELRKALYNIASLNKDPLELIGLFESYSAGDLQTYLREMNKNWESFPDSRSVVDYIIQGAEKGSFSLSELDAMLKLAAGDLNYNFLAQSLIFISSDNLKQTILDLNMEKENIRNSRDLITYLFNNSDKQKYSRTELLKNIEKIRKDPFYYVDLFRKMLSNNATGTLKKFLEEINVRELNLNTFEQLIEYLLNQSKFHDFNREMVYQLLIDIINPKDVGEFIDLLKKYADARIVNAVNAAEISQFSKPLEVVQYLLAVADEYKFTERDLLRSLLKMLLRQGPDADIFNKKNGLFSGINKPALITSIVVVNAIIILLIIIFIMRKKRKNG